MCCLVKRMVPGKSGLGHMRASPVRKKNSNRGDRAHVLARGFVCPPVLPLIAGDT
jgi:hypothetical protein